MKVSKNPDNNSIDHFFSAPSARLDRWRDLHSVSRAWFNGQVERRIAEAALNDVGVIENFHAFPVRI